LLPVGTCRDLAPSFCRIPANKPEIFSPSVFGPKNYREGITNKSRVCIEHRKLGYMTTGLLY